MEKKAHRVTITLELDACTPQDAAQKAVEWVKSGELSWEVTELATGEKTTQETY